MISILQRSKFPVLGLRHARKLSGGITFDITGHVFKANSDQSKWNMDESLIDILGSNKDARDKLREIVKEDNSAHFCKILILFENLRYSMDYRTPEIAECLLQMEELLTEGLDYLFLQY